MPEDRRGSNILVPNAGSQNFFTPIQPVKRYSNKGVSFPSSLLFKIDYVLPKMLKLGCLKG